ncbi:MAG: tripartite tricarboxylate transporter TctB family protein [Paracoccaceae bacterium]|nr:MAG: tripartite tricarboxylate transporter TctB family protein [Paracoccaceae bacterium]
MVSQHPRRPGELAFNAAVFAVSLFLFHTAYKISGFEALSAPGTVPMATTGLMVITAGIVLIESLRKSGVTGERIERDILPLPVIATILLIAAYALLLKPLGFLPTSFLFLAAMIRMLSGRGLVWTFGISAFCVILVWVVFRLVFSVLMPAGIVPEAEFLAFVRNLASGGN